MAYARHAHVRFYWFVKTNSIDISPTIDGQTAMKPKSRTEGIRFRHFIQRLAKELHYTATFEGAPKRASLHKPGYPISIHFENIGRKSAFVYLYVRTSSWDFEGERTDLHDILSVLVCCTLRFLSPGVSCEIFDVLNPAECVPKTEIYARYITFKQPYESCFSLNIDGYVKLVAIVKAIRFFELFFPRMTGCIADQSELAQFVLYDFQSKIIRNWASAVASAMKHPKNSGYVQYNLRRNPCWNYYRSLRPEISVLCNPLLAHYFRVFLSKDVIWSKIQGIKGDLLFSNDTRNFISFSVQNRAVSLLRKLPNEQKTDTAVFVPLENFCVIVGNDHLLFLKSNCGHRQFDLEREKLRSRHLQEATLLFAPSKIIWKPKIDAGVFEDMVLELLLREPYVQWIKKMGDTNEPDGGRDLIAEMDISPVSGQILEKDRSSITRMRVIVQCKVSASAVGKAKVPDIHDTLIRHNATGFFLVVSSQLTVGLIGHLEKLRYNPGSWSDWWGKSDIDGRLMKHVDIVTRYSTIVSFQQT